MSQKITGPSLFLRYAWSCAKSRLSKGLITLQEYRRLEYHVLANREPRVTLLLKCFPNAFEKLINFARRNEKDPWDFKTVQEFWRYHHGH